MTTFEGLFKEVDRVWRWPLPEKQRLRIIGSAALLLQTSYLRGTKDSDVLQTDELTEETRTRLLSVAGRDSALATRMRCYIDIVAPGLPLLPQAPRWLPLPALSVTLNHFDIEVLDVVDVVVSKLKRFSSSDEDDISAMIARGRVPHRELIIRFQSALDLAVHDARADDVPRYIRNLHRVERDEFGEPPTNFDLPDWVGE